MLPEVSSRGEAALPNWRALIPGSEEAEAQPLRDLKAFTLSTLEPPPNLLWFIIFTQASKNILWEFIYL